MFEGDNAKLEGLGMALFIMELLLTLLSEEQSRIMELLLVLSFELNLFLLVDLNCYALLIPF